MKRSEVINIIKQYLEDLESPYDLLEFPNKSADDILTLVEKVGMLPPYRPNSYGFLDEDDEVILDHSWEPEDEN